MSIDVTDTPADDQALSLIEYQEIIAEIEEQPRWRHIADSEMDYADGNQLDGELLKKQRDLGLPPAIENLIGPALRAIQGYEATVRTDWRVTPNGEVGGQDVADALNYKINQAERNSKADKACSDAFETQIKCGLGWVEVSKETDPFKYPYRCRKIHRNEIHWDMRAVEADLSDARWLRRAKWLRPERIALSFPDHKEKIMQLGTHGIDSWHMSPSYDGGASTGLANSHGDGRSYTMHEERWYNPTNKELCVFELWYRRWEAATVIKTPDGRVVEYDEDNQNHVMAVAAGMTKPITATVTRMRRSYWLGPHLLHDAPSPYNHTHFPYVAFWGFREDATGIPYGYVRDMKYSQDSLNSALAKLRWGMAVTRMERTKGAVDMTDAQVRKQAARPDGDIVLNQAHMSKPGARFEIIRDYQLTDQHYQMLAENRESINRTSGITDPFQGKGNAQSGYQEQLQVEQSNQSLADIMDNFREARKHLGELLLSNIIDDLGQDPQTIIIEGDAVTEERSVVINAPERDPETGQVYLSNDISKTRLKVALEDVPSTNSYRAQQLNALSEVIKALPEKYMTPALPHMLSLMDIPNKKKFIEDVKAVDMQQTPEEIQQQIEQAVQDALVKAANDIKLREIELKERKADSEVKGLDAKAVQIGVNSAFAAMQAGEKIAMVPQIAPIADEIMKGAGYQLPTPGGVDPEFPTANNVVPSNASQPVVDNQESEYQAGGLPGDTSPLTPANPDSPAVGANQGIETLRAD
jgi:hypothetical protein